MHGSNAVEFDLRRQTEAVRDLLHAIADAGEADDQELIADAVEGQTDLHEAIEAALDEIDECEAIAAGLKVKENEFEQRRVAVETRIARVRAAIERAMVTLDLPSLRLTTATLSVAKRKPQPVIVNEAEIPARFFVQPPAPPPKLDKMALAAALAEGDVPGARLDNGSISLTVRRR